MQAPIVIIGMGELGGVFARGFLSCGYPVFPITRAMDMQQQCRLIPEPELVLVTVQEDELDKVLTCLPEAWKSKLGLVQNELLPRDWLRHDIRNPSVVVVWFEKKKTMEVTHNLYSSVFGPKAEILAQALEQFAVPVKRLTTMDDLLYELVRKTVYILTVNCAGLKTQGTVLELWQQHHEFALSVATEVIAIQEYLSGHRFDQQTLLTGLEAGILDCPQRNCLGRVAKQRLLRALAHAQQAKIDTPALQEIYDFIANPN